MSFLNFSAGQVYRKNANGTITIPSSLPTLSIRKEDVEAVFYQGNNAPYVFLTYVDNGSIGSAYVAKGASAITGLLTDPDFFFVSINSILSPELSGISDSIILNRFKIVSIDPNGLLGNTESSRISYLSNNTIQQIVIPTGFASAMSNPDTPVVFHPSTEFIFVNNLSLCFDVQIVNHDTGETNIFHTPHRASEWFLDYYYTVTPYGGFLAVFVKNDFSQQHGYFFDNDGNLVDQISGFGPGYQWGELSYRMVYGTDNDPNGSMLKIFDGKNVRTHEFPGLCNFGMSPFSEGDCSKNLYVPFTVYSWDEDRDYLYISTPGGGLINLDYDTWYSTEYWSAVHPSSDKIFRLTYENDEFGKLEMYSEDGVLLITLNLSGLNLNDYDTREYYGSNGNFYTVFYNWGDNTVPYLFVSANANTTRFETLTLPNNGTLSYYDYYRDYDIYDDYSSKSANSVIVVSGQAGMTPSPIFGVNVLASGAQIHWTSPTTGEWFSHTVESDEPEVLISNGESAYGTYPMFVTYTGAVGTDPLEARILLHDGTVQIADTEVDLQDATAVATYALGDLTVAVIDLNTSSVEWRIYDNLNVDAFRAQTTNTFNWAINGSTIAVLDTGAFNNSWSWGETAGGVVADGGGFPTPNDNFLLESDQWGSDYPIWGYNNNGSLILVDRDVLNNIDGFYFLTPETTEWVRVINEYNDTGAFLAVEMGNKHFLYICEDGGNSKFYAMVYNMTTGTLVSGVSLDTAAGGIAYEQVGDRMMVKQEVAPGVYDQYFFTKKGVVQMQWNDNLGSTWYAFNDAEWSWD